MLRARGSSRPDPRWQRLSWITERDLWLDRNAFCAPAARWRSNQFIALVGVVARRDPNPLAAYALRVALSRGPGHVGLNAAFEQEFVLAEPSHAAGGRSFTNAPTGPNLAIRCGHTNNNFGRITGSQRS